MALKRYAVVISFTNYWTGPDSRRETVEACSIRVAVNKALAGFFSTRFLSKRQRKERRAALKNLKIEATFLGKVESERPVQQAVVAPQSG